MSDFMGKTIQFCPLYYPIVTSVNKLRVRLANKYDERASDLVKDRGRKK